MTEGALSVCLYGDQVRTLSVSGNLSWFRFNEAYLERTDRPVLGQQFEESPRAQWRQAQRLPPWFSNVLPEEGPLRTFLADELEISERSEWRLMAELGGDLPGAVTVAANSGGDAISDRHAKAGEIYSDQEWPDHLEGIRFSVAGIQLKLSMILEENTIRLPSVGERGERFVKFPGAIPGIPRNEYAMMRLASLCGIDVPGIELVSGESLGVLPRKFERFRHSEVYVVERFDRSAGGSVHIEDFNQVIGNWPEQKYEGASYRSLGRLVRGICGEEDFEEYLRRVAFSTAIGNEDAHLKNWSLIYPDRIEPRLAPVYDLVTTVGIDGLTRETALRTNGAPGWTDEESGEWLSLAPRALGARRSWPTLSGISRRPFSSEVR